ncbi:MAG: ABC transporter permease, partial [Planctomycetota bacterium]
MRAVLEHDYLDQAARTRAFLSRTGIGALAVGILLFGVLGSYSSFSDSPDIVGAEVFKALSALLFIAVCILTPALMAGTIVQERRIGALPILLASPLTPLGITAGKLTSRVGQVLGWVAAALPPLVTAILFGGVAPGRILDVLLTLLAVVLELGAWGLLVSCISRRMATAAILAYGIPAARWFAFSSSWMTWGAGGGTISGTAFLLTPFPGLYGGQQVIQSGVFAAVPSLAYALFAIVLTASCLLLAARFLGREEDMQSRTTKRIRAIKGEQRLRRWITRGNPVAWKESLLLNTAGSRT